MSTEICGRRMRKLWAGMVYRADERQWVTKPHYRGTTISPEFLSFDGFITWALAQTGWNKPGYHIDKDIIIPGNREYSPAACAFVPLEINNLFTNARSVRGDLPVGVSMSGHKTKFVARVSVDGKMIEFGRFDNPYDAFQCYKKHKESHIQAMAEKYRPFIDERVYLALMARRIQITD